jgi:hypothetical protein
VNILNKIIKFLCSKNFKLLRLLKRKLVNNCVSFKVCSFRRVASDIAHPRCQKPSGGTSCHSMCVI